MTAPSLLWFRNDLRLADNPALDVAAGRPVVALFVLDDAAAGRWRRGGAARWWLHQNLAALGAAISAAGGRLILRRGESAAFVTDLVREIGADTVLWNRRYEPWAIAQDKAIKQTLKASEIEVVSCNGALGLEPWEVLQKGGEPYKVFTPFWRAWQERPLPGPAATTVAPRLVAPEIASLPLDALELLPTRPDWAGGLHEAWQPGEAGALATLDAFLDGRIGRYKSLRDFPAEAGVSRLSPHMAVGTISPRQIAAAARRVAAAGGSADAEPFVRQLVWRDFAYANLYHFPHLPEAPLRPEFERFPWAEDASALRAWQQGRTGYPIVDAGMRELWHTGYMHNRVRMIVGSFLTKDLRLPWQEGAAWFWDTLVDADLANNSMGWQWVAGCGIDAAPYFRVFNPWLQSKKFDPEGRYLRRWLPELAALPDEWLHEPHNAPPLALRRAGIEPGRTYPLPIVDHGRARDMALEAFQGLKAG